MGGRDGSTTLRTPLTAGLTVLVLAVGLLTWAKYQPYLHKVPDVLGTHDLGESILATPDGAVSPAAGWHFTVTYLQAVWKALLAGLVLAAAVQVLLPSGWLSRALGTTGGVSGGIRGGLWSIPTLMCSCCAAPVAIGLRRARASLSGTVAFWLGNPALNPVVLVFCLAVLPWPWSVLRLASGVAVVAAGIAVARAAERRGAVPQESRAPDVPTVEEAGGPLPLRFGSALAGMAVRLLPEFLVVVFLLGMFRGVLFPVGEGAPGGILVVLLLVAAGLLLPVPTGGEIAVAAALLAAGAPPAVAAVLLVTLPMLSLPSVLMLRTALPRRVLAGVAGSTAVVALLAAGLAPAVL